MAPCVRSSKLFLTDFFFILLTSGFFGVFVSEHLQLLVRDEQLIELPRPGTICNITTPCLIDTNISSHTAGAQLVDSKGKQYHKRAHYLYAGAQILRFHVEI